MEAALLIAGILFSFFIPGFCVVETFFVYLPSHIKLALYPLLSIFLSTYSVYFLAIFLGFSKWVVLFVIFFYLILFLFVFWKRCTNFFIVLKDSYFVIIFTVLIFLIYFLSLYPGIFTEFDGYYVMSAENWQDTAMHLGIIESISQGNFPPQAPYFSGYPLAYYYFTDFHSAIINVLMGRFFPRILVYDNPFFASIFFVSVYSLCFQLSRNIKTSVLAGWLAMFYGNLMFLKFFRDLFLYDNSEGVLKAAVNLISSKGYTIDFGGLLQVSSMADYFLQNRPMMVGLPTLAIVSLLSFYSYKRKCFKTAFLAGVLTVLVYKFQMISFAASFLVFVTLFFFSFFSSSRQKDRKFYTKILIYYFFPFCFLFLVLTYYKVGGRSLFDTVSESLRFGVWDKDKGLFWYFSFIFLNFGIQFLMLFAFLFFFGKKISTYLVICLFLFVFFFMVPFVFTFTIFYWDMFKFFYFSIIFISVLSSFVLSALMRKKSWRLFSFLILFFWGLTSFINLEWSALNKNYAYSNPDLYAGLWIRENTPKRSVFLSSPTVHSPIDQIGGRLRVLSYINWPYSHGFNVGEDNVFTRLQDIEKLYSQDVTEDYIYYVSKKYSVSYIYVGPEERNQFRGLLAVFDSFNNLRLVYNYEGVAIYEVIY